jgi:hypothetical protein
MIQNIRLSNHYSRKCFLNLLDTFHEGKTNYPRILSVQVGKDFVTCYESMPLRQKRIHDTKRKRKKTRPSLQHLLASIRLYDTQYSLLDSAPWDSNHPLGPAHHVEHGFSIRPARSLISVQGESVKPIAQYGPPHELTANCWSPRKTSIRLLRIPSISHHRCSTWIMTLNHENRD